MNYLNLLMLSFIFVTFNIPSSAFSVENSHVATEEKSAAMKNLRQKYTQEHKLQGHGVHSAIAKKPITLPKASSIPKK